MLISGEKGKTFHAGLVNETRRRCCMPRPSSLSRQSRYRTRVRQHDITSRCWLITTNDVRLIKYVLSLEPLVYQQSAILGRLSAATWRRDKKNQATARLTYKREYLRGYHENVDVGQGNREPVMSSEELRQEPSECVTLSPRCKLRRRVVACVIIILRIWHHSRSQKKANENNTQQKKTRSTTRRAQKETQSKKQRMFKLVFRAASVVLSRINI